MFHSSWWVRVLCVGALSGVWQWAGGAAAESPPDDAGPAVVKIQVKADRADAGRRWLGVGCDTVPEVLRAHVDLPEGRGLLVAEVVPDSPADKAGLVTNDVLLEVDGEPLESPGALIRAVADAGDEGVKLKWLHRGQTVVKTIQPVARPDSLITEAESPYADSITKEFRWRDGDIPLPFQMRIFGPAFSVPPAGGKDFPKDMKIEITKQGSEPAHIKVEKGDRKWDITEQQLDKLPDDVRAFVERFTGGDVLIRVPPIKETIPLPDMEHMGKEQAMEFFRKPDTRQFFRRLAPFNIEERLESIDRRMEQLQDQLKQLRGAGSEGKDADASSDDDRPGPRAGDEGEGGDRGDDDDRGDEGSGGRDVDQL